MGLVGHSFPLFRRVMDVSARQKYDYNGSQSGETLNVEFSGAPTTFSAATRRDCRYALLAFCFGLMGSGLVLFLRGFLCDRWYYGVLSGFCTLGLVALSAILIGHALDLVDSSYAFSS